MKISIIVPIYNTEKYLSECIESLVNQTYKDIEIILINDGSTDNSKRICEAYAQQYDFISLINKENSGVSNTRNIGILAAKSELIMFVDSDDYVSLNLCETLMENYNNEDLIFCSYIKFSEYNNQKKFLDGETKWLESINKINSISDCNKDDFKYLYNALFFNTPFCKIYKKSKITNLFDPKISLGEDLLFNLNYLINSNSIRGVSKQLYFYRVGNATSLSNRFDNNRLNTISYIFDCSISCFNTILPEKYDKDIVRMRYLEEYAVSIKKMLSYRPLSYKEKLSLLEEYRNENPLKLDTISLISKLTLKYKIFLLLYQYKKDYILLGITQIFNLLKK